MKNIYDVLRQKESEVQQLQKEIEALRVVARLLADDGDGEVSSSRPASAGAGRVSAAAAVAAAVKPEPLSASAPAGIRQFP